ncbi:DUF2147 domain-containing protein [Sphingomonas ginkgonis]|nr:DUF2147 domain-containing protein [Sphingomonas ginkgonis]
MAAASPLEGRWINPKHSVTVRIGACGPTMCGRVVDASPRAREKAAAGGTPNLIGTPLLTNLAAANGGWKGSVFVPDHNIRASANLKLLAPNQLKVQGCVLAGLLCRSQVWTRID